MLTEKHVLEIYSLNVAISYDKRTHPSMPKGIWHPDRNRIAIYLARMDSEEDFDITRIHELIHARNDLIYPIYMKPANEDTIELESRITYDENPEVTFLIETIYPLKPEFEKLFTIR